MEHPPQHHNPAREPAPEKMIGKDPHEQVADIYPGDLESGQEPVIRKVMSGSEPEAKPVTSSRSSPSPESEPTPSEPPYIYVESLADYSNGRYHGVWMDATREPDDIRQRIQDFLADSPTLRAQGETFGDWAIHDHSGFGQIRLDELQDPRYISALANGIAEHGDQFTAWVEMQDSAELREWERNGELVGRFTDAYLGEYDDLRAYGQQIVDDLGWRDQIGATLPPEVVRYTQVDADAIAQDMWLGGEIQIVHISSGRMAVFRGS